jgi:hypothetical protein
MKVCGTLLIAGLLLTGVGCGKEDPRNRPGFVDTSDPSKVNATMTPIPKKKDPTALNMGAGPRR